MFNEPGDEMIDDLRHLPKSDDAFQIIEEGIAGAAFILLIVYFIILMPRAA